MHASFCFNKIWSNKRVILYFPITLIILCFPQYYWIHSLLSKSSSSSSSLYTVCKCIFDYLNQFQIRTLLGRKISKLHYTNYQPIFYNTCLLPKAVLTACLKNKNKVYFDPPNYHHCFQMSPISGKHRNLFYKSFIIMLFLNNMLQPAKI